MPSPSFFLSFLLFFWLIFSINIVPGIPRPLQFLSSMDYCGGGGGEGVSKIFRKTTITKIIRTTTKTSISRIMPESVLRHLYFAPFCSHLCCPFLSCCHGESGRISRGKLAAVESGHRPCFSPNIIQLETRFSSARMF